ncbi:MAG: BatA domain-containing protein [bacterium]|nr:BatA domain-containing protein [bacterium]
MSFLNPGLLLGLLAVSIPILIHLFSRRRFPLIDFSTIKFLKQLQRQQMHRLKLRQWLLLLLRTLAILLITLAFARPALKGKLGAGVLTSNRISMGIVIDGSASMQAKAKVGSSFEQAKSSAQTLISMMSPGDRAFIVLARKTPQPLTPTPSDQPEVMTRALQNAEVWDGPADLEAALDFTLKELNKSQDFHREIYIISDFAGVEKLPPPLAETELFFVAAQAENTDNLAVKAAKITSEIIEPDQPVDLEVTLANYGSKDRQDVYYSVFLNGSRVAEDVVTLAAGAEVKKTHQITPPTPSLEQGSVKLDERDALTVDNTAYYCFSVPQQLNVLLVADPQEGRAIALGLAPKLQATSLIKLQQINTSAWETQTLSQFDVIIFCNPHSFSSAASTRLAHWVEAGGGLLLLPGSSTDVGSVNRDLLEKMGSLRWGEKLGQPGQRGAFLGWRSLDLETPLLRGMLRQGSQPATPQLYQSLRIIGSESASGITCSNGMPFLAESIFGQGKIMLCASSPLQDWSDWAERGIFAPLLHRMVLKLAGRAQENCLAIDAGDELKLPVKAAGGESALLKTPDGQELKLAPLEIGQKLYYVQDAVNPAGIYQLKSVSVITLAAVNVPPTESNLTPPDPEAAFPAWKSANVRVITPENLAEKVKAARYGQELWKVALIAVLLILLLETFIGSSGQSKTDEMEELEAEKVGR